MGPAKGSRTINKTVVKGYEDQQQHDDPSSSSKAKQKVRTFISLGSCAEIQIDGPQIVTSNCDIISSKLTFYSAAMQYSVISLIKIFFFCRRRKFQTQIPNGARMNLQTFMKPTVNMGRTGKRFELSVSLCSSPSFVNIIRGVMAV